MSEHKNFKLLQKSSDSKKKKKRRNKASKTPPADAAKPHPVSLPPETLPVSLLTPPRGQPPLRPKTTSKNNGERRCSSGRRSKKSNQNSPSLLTTSSRTSVHPVQDDVAELSAKARESLRWEGVLEDPQAEEERLEVYRANRRQRYIVYKEALLKQTSDALIQTFHREKRVEKDHRESQQHEALLPLSKDWVKKDGQPEPYYIKMQAMRS